MYKCTYACMHVCAYSACSSSLRLDPSTSFSSTLSFQFLFLRALRFCRKLFFTINCNSHHVNQQTSLRDMHAGTERPHKTTYQAIEVSKKRTKCGRDTSTKGRIDPMLFDNRNNGLQDIIHLLAHHTIPHQGSGQGAVSQSFRR